MAQACETDGATRDTRISEFCGLTRKDIDLTNRINIRVTLNTYTHLGLEDAEDELKRMEELEKARQELDRTSGEETYNTADV